MLVGILGYKQLATLSPFTPWCIVAMLFLTLSRVSVKQLRLERWHLLMFLFQLVGSALLFFALKPINLILAQGVMICMLAPSATSAPVITGRLGGSVESLISYVLLSNLSIAFIVPFVFPLISGQGDVHFLTALWDIGKNLLQILVAPIVCAIVLRKLLPTFMAKVGTYASCSFYIWVVALCIVTARTVFSIVESHNDVSLLLYMVLGAGVVCFVQFAVGKKIGDRYHDRISAGQAFGQKNTVLAIWMAQTYLHPFSAIAPGAYVLWQNIVNSWQMWRKERGKPI